MIYDIKLIYECVPLTKIEIDEKITIYDLIDFLIEAYPQFFKVKDRARILIQSRSSRNYLNSKQNLKQILGKKWGDTLLIEINQQSLITGIKQQQNDGQIYETFDQQNKNEQFLDLIQQQIKIQFQYQWESMKCEIDDDSTLEYIFIHMKQHFNIKEEVYFKWNEVNLSELSKQTMLKDFKWNDQNRINIISKSQILKTQIVQKEVQGEIVEIQFLIEDGILQRNLILNCNTDQTLGEFKIEIINFIGVSNNDMVYIEFFIRKTKLGERASQRTLRQLELTKKTIITAKVRWIGG